MDDGMNAVAGCRNRCKVRDEAEVGPLVHSARPKKLECGRTRARGEEHADDVCNAGRLSRDDASEQKQWPAAGRGRGNIELGTIAIRIRCRTVIAVQRALIGCSRTLEDLQNLMLV